MRLYKPRLDGRRVLPSCSTRCAAAASSVRGEGDFALSSALKLPDSFGNIYLGETFTAYIRFDTSCVSFTVYGGLVVTGFRRMDVFRFPNTCAADVGGERNTKVKTLCKTNLAGRFAGRSKLSIAGGTTSQKQACESTFRRLRSFCMQWISTIARDSFVSEAVLFPLPRAAAVALRHLRYYMYY